MQAVSRQNIKTDPKVAFDTYYQYLTDGPQDLDYSSDDNEWFIFTLQDGELSSSAQIDYLNELQKKFQFASASLQTKLSADSKERLMYYSSLLTIIGTYNTLRLATDTIANYIFVNDESAAQDYIASLTPKSTGLADAISSSIKEYLTVKLDVYKVYNENGCLLGDSDVDTECIINLSDSHPELEQQARWTTQLYGTIERYYNTLKTSFIGDTQQLREIVRGLND